MQKLNIAMKLAAPPMCGLVLATATRARAQLTPPPAPPGVSVARLTYAFSGIDPATATPGVPVLASPAGLASSQGAGTIRDTDGQPVAGVFITSSFSSYYTVSDHRGEYILDLNLIAGLGAWLPARLDGQLLDLTFTAGSSQVVTHPRLDVVLPEKTALVGGGNVTQNATVRADGTLQVPEVAIRPTASGFIVTRSGDFSTPLAVGVRFEVTPATATPSPTVIRFAAGERKQTINLAALTAGTRGTEASATLLPAAFDQDPARNTAGQAYQFTPGKDQAEVVIP